jgi:hypothetical protein
MPISSARGPNSPGSEARFCGSYAPARRVGSAIQEFSSGLDSGRLKREGRPHRGPQPSIHPSCRYARSRWHTRGKAHETPGIGAVWPLQIRCRPPESPVFKPTLTVRPDWFMPPEYQRIRAKTPKTLSLAGQCSRHFVDARRTLGRRGTAESALRSTLRSFLRRGPGTG